MNSLQQASFIFANIQGLASVIGLLGNVLAVCIFARQSLRKYSFSLFSLLKACSDSVTLLYVLKAWFGTVLKLDLNLMSSFFCTTNTYLPYAFGMASDFLITLNLIDRLITIVYPNRFQIFNKWWFKAILIGIGFVVGALVNLILLLETHLYVFEFFGQIFSFCFTTRDAFVIHSWIYISWVTVSVLVVHNILNLKIICFIASSRKRIAARTTGNRKLSRKDRRFAICTIGMGLILFVSKIPVALSIILSNSLDVIPDLFQLLFTIAVAVMAFEAGGTFYINLVLNELFRDEFLRLLRLKKQQGLLVNSFESTTQQHRKKTLPTETIEK